MAQLVIQLFGNPVVRIRNTDTRVIWKSTNAQLLFAVLVLAFPDGRNRDQLAGQLWPDIPNDRARKALSTEIWRLKATLMALGLDIITANADLVYFSPPTDVRIDTLAFEQGTECALGCDPAMATDADIGSVRQALAHYRGDLMEAFDTECFVLPREVFKARRETALNFLLQSTFDRQDWNGAIEVGRLMLAIDPLQEHVHRKLMRCFTAQGNQAAAIRQYNELKYILKRELGVGPMDRTEFLFSSTIGNPRTTETLLARQDRPVYREIQGDLSAIHFRLVAVCEKLSHLT